LLANECIQCLENKIPYVLQIFNHTDDDISESVSEYCMHYISILKNTKIQTREQQTNIEVIFLDLLIVIFIKQIFIHVILLEHV
jgi:hypothetical protein